MEAARMSRDLLQRHPVLRVLLSVTTVIVVLYAIGMVWGAVVHFGDIILLFFLAWIIAFILRPLADSLQQRGLSRALAVVVIYLCLLIAASGGIVLAVPLIQAQVDHVAAELTQTFAPGNFAVLTSRAIQWLHHVGLRNEQAQALIAQLTSQLPSVSNTLSGRAVDAATALVSTIFSLLLECVIVTMLSFYMMLDGDQLVERFVKRLPPSWQPDVALVRERIETSFGGFLRAQLAVALIYGTLSGLILLALGQPNGLLFALLAGLLMLIPFIGNVLAIVPPALLVLLQAPDNEVLGKTIVALVALVVTQHLTLRLFAPQMRNVRMGVHPLVLVAALLVGAQEGGMWGALFAVPLAVVLASILDVFFVRFQQVSSLYPDVAAPEEAPEPSGQPAAAAPPPALPAGLTARDEAPVHSST
jgi:predicted PurR-regulated permease PerM